MEAEAEEERREITAQKEEYERRLAAAKEEEERLAKERENAGVSWGISELSRHLSYLSGSLFKGTRFQYYFLLLLVVITPYLAYN